MHCHRSRLTRAIQSSNQPQGDVRAEKGLLHLPQVLRGVAGCALAARVTPLRWLAPLRSRIALSSLFVAGHRVAVLGSLHPLVIEFLIALLPFAAWQQGKNLPPALCCCALAFAFVVLICIPWGFSSMLRPFVWVLPALLIVSAAAGLENSWGSRPPGWLQTIGDASYSIHLVHISILPAVVTLLMWVPIPAARALVPALLLSLAASIFVGVLGYRNVERATTEYFRGRRSTAVPVKA